MNSKKMFLPATILVTLLLLGIMSSPVLYFANAQPVSSPDSTYNTISNDFALRYISDFGYQSVQNIQSTTTAQSGLISGTGVYSATEKDTAVSLNVQSSLQILNGTIPGYSYTATVTSTNGNQYAVAESNSTSINGNIETSILIQEIRGSMNYNMTSVQTSTTQSNGIAELTRTNVQFSNATGNYYLTLNSNALLSLNGTVILTKTAVINENLFAPIGQYTITYTPISSPINGALTGDTVQVVTPDGQTYEPSVYMFADGSSLNGNTLYGWYVWWDNVDEPTEEIIVAVLETIENPLSIAWTSVEIALYSQAYLYITNMQNTDGGYITMQYYEFVMWQGIIPAYAEVGYYTDQVVGMGIIPWYYIPVLNFPPSTVGWHESPWPTNWD